MIVLVSVSVSNDFSYRYRYRWIPFLLISIGFGEFVFFLIGIGIGYNEHIGIGIGIGRLSEHFHIGLSLRWRISKLIYVTDRFFLWLRVRAVKEKLSTFALFPIVVENHRVLGGIMTSRASDKRKEDSLEFFAETILIGNFTWICFYQ